MTGTILGNRYEILSEVGSGGMAKVYKARCRYLQRNVAVKVLKDEFKDDSEFLKRFETEAQAAASLTHPNIVQIYDVGRENDYYYIVMEYVDGITLKEYIEERGNLEWREAINITIQICSALSKAHSRKIIHRDVKPQNILMTSDGVPKVTDFGIARAASADTATMKIDTIGSVHYSSPEQVRGGYTDEKSDIYSIGVTLFEMVTGKLPFDGETTVAIALKHIQDNPPLPTDMKPGIPEALNMIIMKSMAKSPRDRYETVAEMMQDLENVRTKPNDALDIILPNVKHEVKKYDTKKFEVIGDDDEEMPRTKESGRKKSRTKASTVLIPLLYIVLIGVIIGGVYGFVKGILKDIEPDIKNTTRDVTIRSYVGRDINEVIDELTKEGIEPYDIVYEFNETVDKDLVINQNPLPDTVIKADGWTTLKLVVSKGQDLVEIPEVKYEEHTALKYKLQDELGLVVEEKSEFNEEVGSNLVIRVDPIPGTQVKRGSKVVIYWSIGPEKKEVVVPDLVNLTYEQALAKLMEYNLKIGRTFPEDREGFKGKIVDQAPKAGDTVLEDTAIDVFFEDAKAPTETPVAGNVTDPTSVTNTTLIINLPEGDYADKVRVKAIVVNNRTNTETTLIDWDIPVSEFPHPIVVPVPFDGGITVKVYIDNILRLEKPF